MPIPAPLVGDDLVGLIRNLQPTQGTSVALLDLVHAGLDELPLPGSGHTLLRWRVLSEIAALDLVLVKLFEGHTDALAILAELQGVQSPAGSMWGTWCAEPPDARVEMVQGDESLTVHLDGLKAWCSGAATVTHAVVSCWNAAGKPCLAAVQMDQPGVEVTQDGWHAVGMAGTGSVNVRFSHARATALGAPGAYVHRRGFWHGGAGIAACWLGGALGIARRARSLIGSSTDPLRLMHLGAMDVALTQGLSALRAAATWIDANPVVDAQRIAMQVRAAAENVCESVMLHAGHALGAGPLCRDAGFAQAMASLPVFLRQSHAERDLASLGKLVSDEELETWQV